MAEPRIWYEKGKWRAEIYLGKSPLTGRQRRPRTTLGACDEEGARSEARAWASGLTGESFHGMLDNFARDVEASGAPRTHQPKANTAHSYAGMARRVCDAMADRPVKSVTPLDLTCLYMGLRKRGLSNSTVNGYHQFLCSAFGWAMRMGICDANPARDASHPRQPAPDASGKSYTAAQAQALRSALEAMDDDADLPEWVRQAAFAALLMLECGMRVGEALAVRACDVRPAVPDIRVAGTVTSRGALKRQDTTKRGGGRVVAISGRFLDRVCRHMEGRREEETITGVNGLLRPLYVSQALKEACSRAEIPYKTPHSLRATHATLLIASGKGDMKSVSSRLGHSSVSTTLEYYQGVLPGADRALADAFDLLAGAAQ